MRTWIRRRSCNTRHQVARGSRPDAVKRDRVMLIKATSYQRLTYQIRLLTFLAAGRGAALELVVRKECRLSPDLRAFQKEHRQWLKVERR